MTTHTGSAAPRAVIALLACGLATFSYVTTEALPIGLLSLMASDLRVSPSAVGLLVSGYALVVVAATVPLTRLTARVSRRRLLGVLLAVFVVANAASVVVTGYWALLGCRVLTALSQALFWAVVTPAAAGLVAESVRGRALSVVYGGSALAAVLGVPVGSWLGHLTSWRIPFLALSGLAVLSLVLVVALMPDTPPGAGAADYGSAPDRGRYWALVASTALSVTGAFVAFTYIEPFLVDATHLGASAVSPVLFIRGVAGVVGVVLVGLVVDRNPWLTMTFVVGLQAVALAGQYVLAGATVQAGAPIAISGLTFAGLSSVLGVRVLTLAPGTSDMAAAGTSTAVNIGITAGALLGGLLLSGIGVRSTALAGAGFSLAALVVILIEPALSSTARGTHRRGRGELSSVTGPTSLVRASATAGRERTGRHRPSAYRMAPGVTPVTGEGDSTCTPRTATASSSSTRTSPCGTRGRPTSATSTASSSSTASTTTTATSAPSPRCGPTRSTSTTAASAS
jgi:MFS transporter, DHA1 family, inner membrane transport protein